MNSPTRVMAPIRSLPSDADAARAYLSRYETDRRSIFVGNLPLGTTEDQIKELFEPYGKVEEVIIRESASKFERESTFPFPRSSSDDEHSSGEIVLRFRSVRGCNGSFQHPCCSGRCSFVQQRSPLLIPLRVDSASVARPFAFPRRTLRMVVRSVLLAPIPRH
jgi:hypothetical protein